MSVLVFKFPCMGRVWHEPPRIMYSEAKIDSQV